MKIASLFNRRTLGPSWTFTPTGSIWRLLPTDSGSFVGEARDQEKKRVSFFAVDAESGIPLWTDRELDEPWWAGIEAESAGVVLLHKFATPDMPQHRGILALDLKTGTFLWENQDLTFWFVRDGTVVAHKMMFEKRIVTELDLRSGHVKREIDREEDSVLLNDRFVAESGMVRDLLFPETLDQQTGDSSFADQLKHELPSREIRGNVEYAVTAEFVALNYHVRSRRSTGEEELLDNHFKILDTAIPKVVYKDIIAHDARATVPDSFFIWNGAVYYIKDQRTLTAVKLNPGNESNRGTASGRKLP